MAQRRYADDPYSRRDARELARIRRAQAERRAGRKRMRLGCVAGVVIALIAAAFVIFGGGEEVEREVVYPWRYEQTIAAASERHGVDPYLVCAVIKCESDWNPGAESHAGAIGLMQVMPATAESLVSLGLVDPAEYDPEQLTDPIVNIEYGCACLRFLERGLDSREEVIAGYNAGIGSVMRWKEEASDRGGSFVEQIDFSETAAYLPRVLDAYEQYKLLYPEQPLG